MDPEAGVNAGYLILLGLGVPVLTFSALWFGRLRYQRHTGGQLTEAEVAAKIAARLEELRQQRQAQDEHLAGLIAHLLQSLGDAGSDLHAVQDAVERAVRQ
jgi:hypothetical protein